MTALPPEMLWVEAKDGHRDAYALYRRHYSAAKNPRPKVRLFVGPGEKMVLIGMMHPALFAWRKFLGQRLYTYVDAERTARRRGKSHRPGHCFREAGWAECGVTKRGLVVLECCP